MEFLRTLARPPFAGPRTLSSTARPSAALALAVLALCPLQAAHAQCAAEWVPVAGVTGNINTVSAIAALPGGDVIVAGMFSAAGDVPASNIARYHPVTNSWTALGAGTNNAVNALAVLPGGDVIAGGTFTSAGGVTAIRIARYNPVTNTWSAMGSGTNNIVYALAVPAGLGGDLVAGGSFTTAGGTPASRIARYNPTTNTWSALGSGINGSVYALAKDPGASGALIAGGNFTTAGGVSAHSVARFNPATGTWSAMSSGISGTVVALGVLPSGDVIAGGPFTGAGGAGGTMYLARYNVASGSWMPVGSGIGGMVESLTVLPEGDLVVGGFFSSAGPVAANNIARFNPAANTWNAMGTGTDGTVNALGVRVVDGKGDIFAGGDFNSAGGVPAARVAKYTFGAPAPTITAQPADAALCTGSSASFSVAASSAVATTYQWQIQTAPGAWQVLTDNPVSLPCGGAASAYAAPANFPTVQIGIDACAGVTSYKVRCLVSSVCGSVASDSARAFVSLADVGQQGGVEGADGLYDNNDFIVFIDLFFTADPKADVGLQGGLLGTDGAFDNNDFIVFIDRFFNGCQ